jgi:GT2 family glycosyltransferase
MRDFKNNPEIVKNIYSMPSLPDDLSSPEERQEKIKCSLVICVWSTSHLLKRTIETYCQQDFPTENWELIVIDDNSPDDVFDVVQYAFGRINIRYIRLQHEYGMRGNTVSFNTGFAWANGDVLMESTPEIMFQKTTIRDMYEPHLTEPRAFVATKTYNLEYNTQLLIDTVDWRSDVNNIRSLEGFMSPWTQRNVPNHHFGTHQSCSIKKDTWFEITRGFGFPLYGDYGSDDPFYCGLRERTAVKDITIMDEQKMLVHQWHLPFNFFSSMGYAPMLNKQNHTNSNYLGDESGEVPAGGTAMIWDKGSSEKIGDAEKLEWKGKDEWFLNTGGDPSIIRPRVLSNGEIV